MISFKDIVDYEIKTTWWVPIACLLMLHRPAMWYLTARARMKYRRYRIITIEEHERNIQIR
jgi:hypothetical protein